MITLKDIARAADVSVATVSNALNNNGKTKENIKNRITKIANEMGYIPNDMASGLKKGKTHTIGIISEDITSFNMPDIIDSITEFAENREYSILLSNLRYNQKTQIRGEDYYHSLYKYEDNIHELGNLLLRKKVDGIIYIGSSDWEMKSVLINTTNIPVVYAYSHSVIQRHDQHYVYYDDADAGYIATKALLDLGHKKIGLIAGPLQSSPVQKRWHGYQNALEEAGIPLQASYIKSGPWSFESGKMLSKEILQLEYPPTALFCMNDRIAAGVICMAQELGLEVPKNLSVIGMDDNEYDMYIKPTISTIALPLKKIGEVSIDILLQMIDGKPTTEFRDVSLKCNLILRNSTSQLYGNDGNGFSI